MLKPLVKLVGQDGNAFAIIGRCHRAAKKAGWGESKWKVFQNEALKGDYNHLLQLIIDQFNVEADFDLPDD